LFWEIFLFRVVNDTSILSSEQVTTWLFSVHHVLLFWRWCLSCGH
jgi:hypothetical protein